MSEDLTKKLPHSTDEKLTLVLTTVQILAVRAEKIEHRLDRLEQTVDERLYDTRPIWEKVLADVSQLQQGQEQLQRGQELLTAEVRSVRRDVDSRVGGIYGMLSEIQVDHRDLHTRFTHLELNANPPDPET
ncbi:MAG: hypothetical protein LC794_12200 [Acidobacteria bacterium]|nr:hypothetical protein [Acidobacteriota bacterium]MCA1627430.1 hypothetical protein [Acidobacteriota bacterium]